MMAFTCEQIERRWPEYLYRELDEPEQALFVQHIQRCSRCREEEARWRELIVRFDGMAALDQSLDVPGELVFRVKRQIHLYEDWTHQTARQVRNWIAGTAAACLVVSLAGWTAWEQIPRLLQQDSLTQPWRQSVLSQVYNKQALEVFQEQGILEETAVAEPEVVIRTEESPTGSDADGKEDKNPGDRSSS